MTTYQDAKELPDDVLGMILDAMQTLPKPDDGYPAAGLSDQMKAWIAMKDLAGAIQMGTKTLLEASLDDDRDAIIQARRRFETYQDGEGLLTGDELKRRIRERQGKLPFGNGAGVKRDG